MKATAEHNNNCTDMITTIITNCVKVCPDTYRHAPRPSVDTFIDTIHGHFPNHAKTKNKLAQRFAETNYISNQSLLSRQGKINQNNQRASDNTSREQSRRD